MAIGKGNKKQGKGGKNKGKKINVFDKKEWYEVKAPSMFQNRNIGKTLVTKTIGTKIASDGLKGRVFEFSVADLNNNEEDQALRKIKLIVEDVQGYTCLTNFHGMDLTRDKLCDLIKKCYTLIEGNVTIKTTDGYTLRLFCIGFTKKMSNQIKKTAYAQGGQIRSIRKQMVKIMTQEAVKCDLKELVAKFNTEIIGEKIIKACGSIYPLQNVHVRKVKVLKKPKFDLAKLMELHENTNEDVGASVNREAPLVESAVGSGGRL